MSSALQLPANFEQSYKEFRKYPCNLVYKSSYPRVLEEYKLRLNNVASTLLTDPTNPLHFPRKQYEPIVHVPFRDWNVQDQKFEKQNVFDDAALKRRIGDQSPLAPSPSNQVGAIATKRDPKCRFIFIYGESSRSRLKITQEMLVRILSYHQVMPIYLDFITVFGARFEPNDLTFSGRDLRFSGFHDQNTLSICGPAVPTLGRSGRQYQMCYNLKTVACISRTNVPAAKRTWSIRQAAFHHQFDVEEGTTLWIITKGGLDDLKDKVQSLTGPEGRLEDRSFGTTADCFRSSLAVHLMYCHWSTEGWRWYIEFLEDAIETETRKAVIEPNDPSQPGQVRRKYTPRDLQTIQANEDKTNEAIMILEANVDVMSSLREFYKALLESNSFPLTTVPTCSDGVNTFEAQINNMIYSFKMHIARAKLLIRISAARKSLILQHLQSQATEKMENLTSMSHKEAIVIKIITIVTLVYLPATFVSTFFSTDIIKYQNANDGNGTFSRIALERWLQVTLPLTALTLSIGWIGFKRADAARKSNDLPLYNLVSHEDTAKSN